MCAFCGHLIGMKGPLQVGKRPLTSSLLRWRRGCARKPGWHPWVNRRFAIYSRVLDTCEVVVRADALQRTGLVETGSQLCGNRKVESRDVVGQLLQTCRPDDGRGDARLGRRPIEGHLRRRLRQLPGNLGGGVKNIPVAFREALEESRSRTGKAPLAFRSAAFATILAA